MISKEDKISDSTLSELDEPANYKEAMAILEATNWKEAMKSKIQIDYEETFSLVAKIKSIRIMLAIVAFHDYEIWQMDVKTAFLIEKLIEDVFMAQPEGDAAYILGLKIYRDRSKLLIGLSQDTKDICPKNDEVLDRMSRFPYVSAIGSIMYAMTCTRPDVSFALSMVSQHQQNPGEGYWTAVKNILKYLRITKDRFLVYIGEEELKGAVTWKSLKEDIVADSTCESEYIAACEASKEAIWMKNFIRDLRVVPKVQEPIEIFCDNKSVVALIKEPKDHRKSKLIESKNHFVRSKVEEGHMIVKHI
ncbi:retrotransposon protein, putative, ty1-copia subclass [Tanacetum coccineum]